ncbi:MAG: 7TM-DISM domain-containing protein [Methylotenera sp.]|nr:7TM-DISM domain-containing protein [Methylotenera sp.]MDP2101533.1 7TM-DISM domain-containing protein [Methylotenera sp.]MDP2281897.1 7TM-DISM domain-containing protein [Methylotenera sp.]MDP2403469.1 7TM-DISM domain-containing protein [Methylotenera sp.]MDP3060776.1 7TM-DISM domain-containing protein [Methylotenera sp.]
MPRLFLYLLGFLVFVVSASAWGDDLITSRAVFEDKSGTLKIDDVTHADFQPTGELLAKGYTNSAHWIRVQVRAPKVSADKNNSLLELRIRPTFLDEVILYEADPLHAGRWISHATGDTQSYLQRERPAATPGFVVSMPAQEATYYLRLKTTSSSLMNVEALTPIEARTKDIRLDLFQALYLGFMLWILFWAANDYVVNRQPIVGLFLIYQSIYSLYAVAIMGYIAFLLPHAPVGFFDKITSTLICLAPLASLTLHRILFSLFAPPRRVLYMLDGLIVMGLLVMTMLMFGYVRQALHLNALIILLAAPTFVGLAFTSRTNAPPGLLVIRSIYSLQALSLLISMLPLLGLVRATEWNLQATLVHGFISAFLMFLLLHLRSRALNQQAKQNELDLALTRQHLSLEQTQKQQQERFVSMLIHELKTPMSVIGLELAAPKPTEASKRRIEEALQDMNAVVEHCQQADQLERQQLVMRATPCRIEELLDEVIFTSGVQQRFSIQTDHLPMLTTDRQLLRVTLNNLVSNAIKYAAKESIIDIRAMPHLRAKQSGVLVVISNQPGAAGLPDPDKVFNKYYRSPGAHRKTGSGLGLYLVKSYMALLGGEVAYNVVDHYVEFSIWLPC